MATRFVRKFSALALMAAVACQAWSGLANTEVLFDANGGEGEMEPFVLVEGTEQTLPESTFTKEGYFLLGWALTPDGEATLLDGDSTADIVAEAGETVMLYAVWHEGEGGGNGLSVKYYDISSSGYSTWTQSEAAMTNYFAAYTPTIETNTLDWGENLSSGFPGLNNAAEKNMMLNAGMTELDGEGTCRFHGKYANYDYFSAFLTGQIRIEETSEYSFATLGDDYIVIYIDGTRVCNAQWNSIAQGSIALDAGWHRISMAFHENSGGQGLIVQWKKPCDALYSPIPQSALSDGNIMTYAVRFDANGGAGTMAKRVYAPGDDVALPTQAFVRDGWTFVGWATEADGLVEYADGATVNGGLDASNGDTTTLYARWGKDTYTVHFDANGGDGVMADESLWLGIPDTLTPNAFTRTGYTFVGWAMVAEGEILHGDGALVTNLTETANASVTLYATWDALPPQYLVIDLESGSGAASYLVTYLAEPPEGGFNADEYKTTKLALRRIDPGTFMMGGQYETTLTRPYFMGVFEVTQKQYELVMGSNPSSYTGDMRPVERVSYNMIRGSNLGAQWPASSGVDANSFMGKLQSRTGIGFDLPTEAQWEYACRAGTTSAYNNGGDTEDDLRTLGRYDGNQGDGKGGYSQHTIVGSYLPNAWGLFDMHGSVWEWCLDWYGENPCGGTNPVGYSSGAGRVRRSGSWYDNAACSASSFRYYVSSSYEGYDRGFRLALQPCTYAIRFDENGGQGTMTRLSGLITGADVALPSSTFTRDGWILLGWATEATGPVAYADGAAIDGGLDAANGGTLALYARWTQEPYTVHFDANGGEGTMADELFGVDIPGRLTPNAFTRTGYDFAGWATAADGEMAHGDKALVTNLTETANATVNLYAVWSPNHYQVRFNSGSGTGSMPNQTITYDAATALSANTFAKTGYHFVGWATEADGEAVYDDCDEALNLAAGEGDIVDLYATWAPNGYTVVFDANGGTRTMEPQQFTYDEEQALNAKTFVWRGHFFAGWAMAADGAVAYADGAVVSNLTTEANGEVRLYAVWAESRVVFDANGGEGSMGTFFVFSGTEQTLPQGTFTKDGCFLLGWARTPDGEATLLDGDSTAYLAAQAGETVTLYAVWHEGEGNSGGLLHRWSFNGDLTDSASGQDAVAVGNVTNDGQSYRLAGGNWGNSYIDLGSDVLPKDGSAATIEIWATKHSFQRWGRIFDFGTGSGDSDYVFMAWSGQYDSDCPFRIYGISGNVLGLEPYNSNREYHFAMVFEPDANGTWGITAYKQDAGTGETLKTVTLSSGNSGWSLPNQGMQTCWLGHSRYSADRDANASYNEVRVWRKALTESELAANALNGPDAYIANAYAIRFDANGGAGTMAKRVYATGEDMALPAMAFERDGWTFVGWGTEADGPVVFADEEAFEGGFDAANGETVTLYARWSRGQYAVHFDANGGDGAMADESLWLGIPDTLPPSTFTRTGYTFAGWATAADGDVAHGDGAQVVDLAAAPNGEATLYAVWSPHEWTICFYSEWDFIGSQVFAYDSPEALDGNTATKTGYTFVGWATEDGGEKAYDDGEEILNLTTEDGAVMDFFAIWSPNSYTVAFDANGGAGTMADMQFTFDEEQSLPANAFARENRFFAGWATAADGAAEYADGAVVSNLTAAADGVVTLYAVWADARIVFEANGGEGEMAPFHLFAGTEQTLPQGTFTMDGYFLLGWALTPDGEATLLDGDSTADIVAAQGETVTLYAVWHEGNAATGGECTTGGNANWFVQTSDTHDGIAAARSGAITFSQSSWLETTIEGEGTFSFWWKVSSEAGYDFLTVTIDGVQKDRISGSTSWTQKSFAISGVGVHTIRWTYSEDNIISSGSDCGWVGEVTWPNSDKPHKWVVDSAPPQLDGFDAAYAVRFDANGGAGMMAKRVYAAGDDIALPANVFTRDGWSFLGWATSADGLVAYADGEAIDGGIDAANGATVTLYARWVEEAEIRFNANGGAGSMASQSFPIGYPFDLAVNGFSRVGYSFAGWATEPDGDAAYMDGETVTIEAEKGDAVDLFAVWTPNGYEVSFDPTEGAFAGAAPTMTAVFDSPYGVLPVASRTGYTLAWTLGGEAVTAETICTTPSNHTLVASWTPNEYEVSFDANGGDVGTDSKTVTFGAAYGALPTPSFEWHSFRRWTLNGNRTISAESVVSTAADHTLVADWNLGIGGGAWEYPDGDGPITLGAPLAAASGNVVIPAEIDGRPIAAIGAAAFAGNTAITSVSIPASVTNIADGAFAGCTGLRRVAIARMYENRLADLFPDSMGSIEEVVFGDGIEAIPDNFFEGCTALKSMDIPESVVDIGTNVFEACSALATTTLENGLRVYQGWCLGFAGVEGPRSKVESLAVPETHAAERPEVAPYHVRGIAAGAFEGETGIATVSLPESLVFIGARAFANCTRLEWIAVPEGVAKIDREAFRNCTRAQGLSLPESLRVVGEGAFANCTRFTGVTLPFGVEEIGGCAFSNCWRVTSVSIPQSVERVGLGAFADCENITEATVPLHVAPMAELLPSAYDKLATVNVASLEVNGGSLGELAPPFVARQMVAGVFAGCAALEGIALPEWVCNISEGAFEGCSAIEALALPDAVTNIDARACASMAALETVKFPASLATIGAEAFDGDAGIASLALPNGLQTIGERAFRGLSLLARADIPASVRVIGNDTFAGCGAIRSVSMPGDVATVAAVFPEAYDKITSAMIVPGDGSLGELAPPVLCAQLFAGCSALTRIELPQDLAEIGEQAFANCSALSEVGIPAAVTNIGASTFQNCSTLSSIALPRNLAAIEDGTFAGCAALAEITIPESVGTLGDGVFSGCTLLRSVRFVGNAPSYSTASGGPYAGVPSDAVSYVPDGSTGWDGIAFSQDLPRYWPNGTTYRIDWWDPTRLTVAFDPCDGTAPVEVEQVTGTSYVLPADPVRQGASFGGWWTAAENGARITASTQVTATSPHTYYAHWTMNRYFIHLDANGGSGSASPVEMTVGTAAALPACPFAYVAHAFMGWATSPDGPVVYADGATVCDLAYANNAAVTLYAVWAERDWAMPDYLDAPGLAFETEGGLEWSGDWEEFKVGGASLTSGELPPSEIEGEWTNTVLRTTVLGEGSLSFWWKVSCEPEDEDYGEWYDFATFSVDGVEVAIIAGESGWRQVECVVSGPGTHVLEWAFFRDDYDDDGADYDNAMWVDGVEWTPAPVTVAFAAGVGANGETPTGVAPAAVTQFAGYALVLPGCGTLDNAPYVFTGWTDGETVYAAGDTYVLGSADVTLTAVWELKTWTLAEAVDAGALAFTTGGTTEWTVDATTGWTNGVSAKSGVVANGQLSWVETTVTGGGTLAFRWKVLGGIYRNNPFAFAKVEVDGVSIAQTHLTDGWEAQALAVVGAGTHTIRWTYLRTSSRTADGDCAWLDGVSWESEAAEAVVVDGVEVPASWLEEEAAPIVAANGGSLEEAAAALAANGVNTVAECYVAGISPTNATQVFRTIISWENGEPKISWEPDLNENGTKNERVYTILGRVNLNEGDWAPVTDANRDEMHFFKVKVEMP